MPRLSAATAALSTTLLNRIRAHLEQGGVIAYPTESCYGLGCDPRNRRAVMKILRIKGRPQHKGLILIGSTFVQLQPYAAPLTEAQWHKISPTWPGPVTWLLPATSKTPPWLRGRHQSIAVRVTAHPLAVRLCQALNLALVSTSANRSGKKPARTAAACAKIFGPDVLVVPGLIGKRRQPSTIMDLMTGAVIR
ncbi:MAG: Sua5/YciO/YrdC/YwlC family protein [Sulfurimicrobium sp.]|nr:Sua5/YciO/YrdC/YwlC family protein [Sulfurimicrobium sp.]MDO9188513.1 Sua5/YciO/YrdC/YwlC family protein [Sulfurimicrobium sp.]MDP1705736.1 Sua5/YciO/YrdC/YwlC family protein [Sulfurimicrobium sp.]MDP2198179.1 Sua5/YciO/YrdC/YwlC family protein [Sulfurimicrobium sp.]MDP3688514.1 Sua5/YciO/YrdC/YwlC family protein [Sulfurimicrobium sp.]